MREDGRLADAGQVLGHWISLPALAALGVALVVIGALLCYLANLLQHANAEDETHETLPRQRSRDDQTHRRESGIFPDSRPAPRR